MRKISFLKVTVGLLVILMAYQAIDAISFKSVKIGRYKQGVADILAQTETVPSRNRNFWYGDNFYRYYYWTNPWHLGVRDFTDAAGDEHPYMIANSPQREYNEGTVLVAQYLDEEMNNTIYRYFRHTPPEIWVDGLQLHDPKLPGDFYAAADSIEFYEGGNAEVMVRSRVNTWIGLTIDARALAFSQVHHDQYVIYDRTYTNTGLTQYRTEPTLTDTLHDIYWLRGFRGSETSRNQFGSRYGEYPGDTLRITYNYPARGEEAWDRVGCRNRVWSPKGTLSVPYYFGGSRRMVFFGNAALHIDSTASIEQDAVTQPFNHGYTHTESPYLRNNATATSPEQKKYLYWAMSEGFSSHGGVEDHTVEPLLKDLDLDPLGRMPFPGHHEIRMDDYCETIGAEIIQQLPNYMYGIVHYWGAGPWTLAPGEDFRIVFAEVFGGLGITKAQEVNEKWNDGTLTWGDYSYNDYPNGETPDNVLPPQFWVNPPAMWQTPVGHTEWRADSLNWAKDNWMHTGKDSLFKNAYAAQWAVRNDYDVPLAPPPPSVEIVSMPDNIIIYWGSDLPSSPGAPFESEDADDFAGYRIYRSASLNDDMELLADIPGKGTYSYKDPTEGQEMPSPKRGMAYYYAVTAYDDGTNGADVYSSTGGEVLESGKFINRTTLGAHLTRKPTAGVDSFRVVPNPFHIGAYDLQYGREEPDKIMFLDLPPVCTIRIFSESGDLVKTIEHTNLSGDESWGILAREHSVTESGQYIVSGVYIAYIETPEGESAYQKFLIIR